MACEGTCLQKRTSWLHSGRASLHPGPRISTCLSPVTGSLLETFFLPAPISLAVPSRGEETVKNQA